MLKVGSACFRVALLAKQLLLGIAKRHESNQPAFRISMRQLQISLQEDEGGIGGGHNFARNLAAELMDAV